MLKEHADLNEYYLCPKANSNVQIFRDYIQSTFPVVEKADIFGMHENANLTYNLKETKILIDTVMAI